MDTVHALEECYRTLEVDLGASPFAIKRQYRRLAKKWHPDRYPAGSPEQVRAVEEMQKINHAYRQIRRAPLRYRAARPPSPPPPPPRRATPPPTVKGVYAAGEIWREYLAASARREASVRRAVERGFVLVVALVLLGAWRLSGWFLLALVPLTEALLLQRWSPGYFRIGPVVASFTVPASRVPLPSGIEADLEMEFDGTSWPSQVWTNEKLYYSGGYLFALAFRRLSTHALVFRGSFRTLPIPHPVYLLQQLLWPVLVHGELRTEGTSPCVTVRCQCPWSLLVCLLVLAWQALNADFVSSLMLSLLLLPLIVGWLFLVRSGVRAIALAVTTLVAHQDR